MAFAVMISVEWHFAHRHDDAFETVVRVHCLVMLQLAGRRCMQSRLKCVVTSLENGGRSDEPASLPCP